MAISTNPKPTIYRILYENTDPERYFSSVIYKDKYQKIVDISTPIKGIAENPCFCSVSTLLEGLHVIPLLVRSPILIDGWRR